MEEAIRCVATNWDASGDRRRGNYSALQPPFWKIIPLSDAFISVKFKTLIEQPSTQASTKCECVLDTEHLTALYGLQFHIIFSIITNN